MKGYIITTTATADEQTVRALFADYGVLLVRSLGNHQYELHLQNDPGLDVMLHAATRGNSGITAVQPNYSYGIN